jgi:acetolactate synthase I/II/III large subunit
MGEISGAEAMVRMLQLHNVKHIFGLCGDTSLPFYDALYRLDHGITHILTRDERSAGYMADGYARVSGKVGVCEGPSGGGATYILPALVEANESSIPVLAITTDISTNSVGHYALTELDQKSLFRPLTKWNDVIDRAERVPSVVRTAFRAMTTGKPGSAHIGFPFNVQKELLPDEEIWAQPELGTFPSWRFGPDPQTIKQAVSVLLSARRPLLLCGGGILISGAQAELLQLSESLGAPVATTISGQGSMPENHCLCLGVVGSNGGTPPIQEVLNMADLVVFIGCRAGSVTTERWRSPRHDTRIIHLDIDPMVISANYRTEVALVGDAKLALRALIDELLVQGATGKRDGAELVAQGKTAKFAAFRNLANQPQVPLLPERILATLHEILPRDAVVVCDPGTPCPYVSSYYEFVEAGRHFISNRAHGALGFAMSAAVGAYYGRPKAKIVAIMGDGSFGFTLGELETIVRLKVPVMMLVISNSNYGWIKAGQKAGFGERYFSVDFSRTDHAGVAEAFGIRSWRVQKAEELAPALVAAAENGGPTLVDIITQPLHEANAPVSEWIA